MLGPISTWMGDRLGTPGVVVTSFFVPHVWTNNNPLEWDKALFSVLHSLKVEGNSGPRPPLHRQQPYHFEHISSSRSQAVFGLDGWPPGITGCYCQLFLLFANSWLNLWDFLSWGGPSRLLSYFTTTLPYRQQWTLSVCRHHSRHFWKEWFCHDCLESLFSEWLQW